MDNMEVINDGANPHLHHHQHNQQQQQQHQHHHHYTTTTTHHSTTAAGAAASKIDRRLFCGSDCGDAENGMSTVAIDEHDHRSTTDLDPLQHNTTTTTTDAHGNEIEVMSYAEQMNEIRLQEAQCRLKEAQLRCELQQLAVTRAQEEMRQTREMHLLHISEMQLKLDKMKKELRMSMN